MRVHGITEFELEMSEWKGKVRALVLELQADFDVVLGMEWHQEWEPVPNWKKLEFTVETTQGTKRIRRLPGAPEFKKLEEIEHDLDLMSEKELEKEVKGGQVIFCLYFGRKILRS